MLDGILFVIISLAGIVFGSNIVVVAAQKIARTLKISELFIGLTVTAIGTSLPEIFTNIAAAVDRNAGIQTSSLALGQIIGSSITDMTLIMGIAGFIGALGLRKSALKRDGMMMVLTGILFLLFASNGVISAVEGVIMLIIFVGYILFVLQREKAVKEVRTEKSSIVLNLLLLALGFAAIIYFANILVLSAVNVAKTFNVSMTLIGVLIGLGTAAPEMSVSITAAIRRSAEMSLGNLIGSTVVNILLAIGIGATISNYVVSLQIITFDIIYMLLVFVLALIILFEHARINKKEALVLILLYVFFLYLKIMFGI